MAEHRQLQKASLAELQWQQNQQAAPECRETGLSPQAADDRHPASSEPTAQPLPFLPAAPVLGSVRTVALRDAPRWSPTSSTPQLPDSRRADSPETEPPRSVRKLFAEVWQYIKGVWKAVVTLQNADKARRQEISELQDRIAVLEENVRQEPQRSNAPEERLDNIGRGYCQSGQEQSHVDYFGRDSYVNPPAAPPAPRSLHSYGSHNFQPGPLDHRTYLNPGHGVQDRSLGSHGCDLRIVQDERAQQQPWSNASLSGHPHDLRSGPRNRPYGFRGGYNSNRRGVW
ncbi:Hypothetical predicted protein [Lecanosticta acicola]|uniref:Uncharacterized protein n=1 Tax=Lecanosticta acicola TaxID=111012 RepID=A0AAI9EBM8_9PEZI|nr:Hypothetical predicted protein [Lecanosticta acicola]